MHGASGVSIFYIPQKGLFLKRDVIRKKAPIYYRWYVRYTTEGMSDSDVQDFGRWVCPVKVKIILLFTKCIFECHMSWHYDAILRLTVHCIVTPCGPYRVCMFIVIKLILLHCFFLHLRSGMKFINQSVFLCSPSALDSPNVTYIQSINNVFFSII